MSRNSIKFIMTSILVLSGVSSAKNNHKDNGFFEDTYIIEGLFYENIKNMEMSSKIFDYLFEKTKNIEYLKRALNDEIDDGNTKISKRLLEDTENYLSWAKESNEKEEIAKKLVVIYLETGDKTNQNRIINEYLINSKNPDTLLFLSVIYRMSGEYQKAYKILKKIYKISPNYKVILKEVDLLYKHLNKKDEAKKLLESYIKMHKDADLDVYFSLIAIYTIEKDFDNALRVYRELYAINPKKIILEKIIKLYIHQKNIKGLEEFLQKHKKGNEELLYMIYKELRDIDKAINLAQELYQKTKEPKWLAEEAMLMYEKAKKENKITPSMLKNFSNLFDRAIKGGADDSIYLNYYGYTLIEHNLNIKRGIKLVKQALKQKPKSFYYLDSLSWGYYKEGKCKEAEELMDRVVKLGGLKEPEIKEHKIKIDKCINNKKDK